MSEIKAEGEVDQKEIDYDPEVPDMDDEDQMEYEEEEEDDGFHVSMDFQSLSRVGTAPTSAPGSTKPPAQGTPVRSFNQPQPVSNITYGAPSTTIGPPSGPSSTTRPGASSQFTSISTLSSSSAPAKDPSQMANPHISGLLSQSSDSKYYSHLEASSLDNYPDKPWNREGADPSDYFNYGFNEHTWRLYRDRQLQLRRENGSSSQIGVYQPTRGQGTHASAKIIDLGGKGQGRNAPPSPSSQDTSRSRSAAPASQSSRRGGSNRPTGPSDSRPPPSRREDSRYDSRSDSRRDDSRRDDSRRDDSRRDDSRRDDSRRDDSRTDSKKENVRTEPKRDDSRRDDSRREESRRDESRRDDARPDKSSGSRSGRTVSIHDDGRNPKKRERSPSGSDDGPDRRRSRR